MGDTIFLQRCIEWLNKHTSWGCFEYLEVQSADARTIDTEYAIIGDWNDKKATKMARMLKQTNKANVRVEYYDEWTTCTSCNKAVRTNPTHYGWLPNFVHTDYDILCRECALDYIEDVIEEYRDVTDKALMPWIKPILEDHGWKCFEPDTDGCARYESGFHPGQTDDPVEIAKWLQENMPEHMHIFVITDIGQFDMRYTVMLKPLEDE